MTDINFFDLLKQIQITTTKSENNVCQGHWFYLYLQHFLFVTEVHGLAFRSDMN